MQEKERDSPAYTVLVVDDNEWNRDLLSRRLERKGYETVVAADGHEALKLMGEKLFDLVLLDIMMPGLSGIEVLRAIRDAHSAQDLPVIMATAKDGSDDMVEALDLGANDYVTKPLDFPVVLARVAAQLRSKIPASARPAARAATAEGTDAVEIGPGAVLMERYRLDRSIGSGSFGTVFQGLHLGLQRPVAIKVLQANLGTDSEALSRFQREGVSACRVRHPHAVEVLDFGVTPKGVAFLVMELLEGYSLSEEMHSEGPMDALRCHEILVPMCDALAEAHRVGIIHRDIKPANIFLTQTSRGEVVKVLDFGIAKLLDDSVVEQQLTLDGGLLGTPAYMAPERVRGLAYDGRTDVYSVGVMLYQMLSGRLPFGDDSGLNPIAVAMKHLHEEILPLRSLRPDLPATVDAVVSHALARDPAMRPTIDLLGREFAMALGLPVAAPRAPRPRPRPASGPVETPVSESMVPTVVQAREDFPHESAQESRPAGDEDAEPAPRSEDP